MVTNITSVLTLKMFAFIYQAFGLSLYILLLSQSFRTTAKSQQKHFFFKFNLGLPLFSLIPEGLCAALTIVNLWVVLVLIQVSEIPPKLTRMLYRVSVSECWSLAPFWYLIMYLLEKGPCHFPEAPCRPVCNQVFTAQVANIHS